MPRIQPPKTDSRDPVQSSALAHQPALLAAFTRLYGTLWSHGLLDLPTKEMTRLRNARITDCTFCRSVRFSGAREAGLTEGLVDEIRDGYAQSDALTQRQKAALRFTDAFLRDPAGHHEKLRAELLLHFTPAEIVELAAGVALFMGFSKIAVALGQVPREMPVTVMPTPDHSFEKDES
ncbi:MAG TPA: carboxymuconolactone decarboxylase family protein [Myxococcota bacterium]|nr:carboxymuconolactone decarboxylase family protein [Myxococcota bacterium]